MCAMSMIMAEALTWPVQRWNDPEWRTHFETLAIEAKKYDEKTGQPDCENDEKKAAIQKIADELGIKINFPE